MANNYCFLLWDTVFNHLVIFKDFPVFQLIVFIKAYKEAVFLAVPEITYLPELTGFTIEFPFPFHQVVDEGAFGFKDTGFEKVSQLVPVPILSGHFLRQALQP